LDGLYSVSGAIAAICILLICAVVSLQVIFNIITRLRLFEANLTIPSYAEISGYGFAAASFFALAYTLTRGGHIRVTLFLGALGDRVRYVADLFCLLLCGALSAVATFYMAGLNYESFEFGDKSSGLIAVPLWIVQLPLTIGLAIMTIAFADLFAQVIRDGRALPTPEPKE
jgi:TRAP-type C4-dicarboxylate transport system permease small subunit